MMSKTTLVVAATAILSFGAGFWTQSIMVGHPVEAATITRSTISPSDMHGKLKSDDVPVQYMKPGDFY
jgi:hypothetical protein